jgi:hypothetical protein
MRLLSKTQLNTWQFVVSVWLIFFTDGAYAQTSGAMEAKEIIVLIPDKIIKGYNPSGSPHSKVMQVGTLTYSLAERKFSAGNKKIKILLFDYLKAPSMFTQATKKFSTYSPVVSDSLVFQSIVMTNGSGWETHNINSQNSQIRLGVCDRFFLIIEGENVHLDELRMVLHLLQLENFPR